MKDRVDRALDTLKKYCEKRPQCYGCRFEHSEKSGSCVLYRNIPANWKKPDKEDK